MPTRSTRFLLCLLLPAVAALPGCAMWHYQLGSNAYSHRNYTSALEHFRLAAQAGDGESQHNLGYMYGTGEGTAPDPQPARYWFSKAAAQYDYGIMCREGQGGPEDPAVAAAWLLKAAEQGDVRARLNLGLLIDA